MDNYHQGDLTDIFRATLAGVTSSSSSTSDQLPAPPDLSSSHTWHHRNHHFSFSDATVNDVVVDPPGNTFGDPFSNMRDPFLHDLDLPAANPSSFFTANNAPDNSFIEEVTGFAGSSTVLAQNLLEDHDMRIIRPPVAAAAAAGCNGSNSMFSSMIQISPGNINTVSPPCDSSSPANMSASPRGIRPPAPASSAVRSGNMVDSGGGVQISSPRNPGLKRRKSQAKKVVCIPAPAAANSRPSSGEVVPSDLWAWRKYGQKPIKGSPYPRGYYRCSSSKGCSARKQVERSRTDPNMLVITYTSEHNHPWPTQRNALAGSTRSQPSKNNNNNDNSNSNSNTAASSKNNNAEGALIQSQNGMSSRPKEEEEQQQQTDQSNSDVVSNRVKEEMEVMEDAEKHIDELEIENNNNMECSNNINNNGELSDESVLGYKPSMCEDFFAELGEIEADPLNLLFTQGFNEQQQQQRESKALDPFLLFDWSSSSGDHNTATTTTSFEAPKRGL